MRGARLETLERQRQCKLDVALRAAHAALEIAQARRVDPRVVPGPGSQTLPVDLGREELSERGAHSLEPGCAAGEVDIGIDREAHSRQYILQALHLRALQAHR